jgi:cytoskeletal protein RodZ
VDLLALAKEIKLRPDLVRALEEERFADLPQEPYLKGHLRAYARQLDLAPEKVVEDYLARYRAWKDRSAS